MVDLPLLPERIVTTTAPTSSVTRGQMISQGDAMAGALSKVADATMDIASKQAKEQAANDLQNQKITRDADGNVTVANPATSIIFGPAGDLYHAAVQAGTEAQHGNVISQTLNDLHQKFPTDPAAFMEAADSFKLKYLQQHGGGVVGEALARDFDQTQTQHYNSITDTAGKIDLKTQDSALSANQASARSDVLSALRGGVALDDPGLQTKIVQYDRTTEKRAANPLFGYSQEQAQLDRESFHSEAAASRWLYDVDTTYKDTSSHEETGPNGEKIQVANGGYKAALAKAQDILTNPAYKLSEAQREQYYHRATAEIHTNEALRRQDLGEVRAGFSQLTMQSASGLPVDSDQVEQLGKAAEAAGDPGLKARIFASFIRKPLNDSFGQQPIAQMTQQIAGMAGMNAVRDDVNYLLAKGYGPIAAAAAASHFAHEGGGDSAAIGDTGTSGGIAQFHDERPGQGRLTDLKKFAADRGKPWTDHTTQLDFVDRELHTTESGTLAKLMAAKTPEEGTARHSTITNAPLAGNRATFQA